MHFTQDKRALFEMPQSPPPPRNTGSKAQTSNLPFSRSALCSSLGVCIILITSPHTNARKFINPPNPFGYFRCLFRAWCGMKLSRFCVSCEKRVLRSHLCWKFVLDTDLFDLLWGFECGVTFWDRSDCVMGNVSAKFEVFVLKVVG